MPSIKFETFLKENSNFDTAHDLAHTKRVVANARHLLKTEPAAEDVVVAAAWLHDCVVVPKDHPDRKKASAMAAKKASVFLQQEGVLSEKIKAVAHAIEAHSFSAGITPETIEAKVVQDADRLDALGAIGLARCFVVGGELGRPLYDADDPFCNNRAPDDSVWTVDHFYTKLFLLPESMNTKAAKIEANHRIEFMKQYLDQLKYEIETQSGLQNMINE